MGRVSGPRVRRSRGPSPPPIGIDQEYCCLDFLPIREIDLDLELYIYIYMSSSYRRPWELDARVEYIDKDVHRWLAALAAKKRRNTESSCFSFLSIEWAVLLWETAKSDRRSGTRDSTYIGKGLWCRVRRYATSHGIIDPLPGRFGDFLTTKYDLLYILCTVWCIRR